MALALPASVSAVDVPPSQSPPGGLQPSQVPQFVVFGFDDQINASAFRWVFKMFSSKTNPAGTGNKATHDGTRASASFYTTTTYGTQYHTEALGEGHEIGNHTQTHPDGSKFSVASWESQLSQATGKLTGAGIPKASITGFRAPFLLYNNNLFTALRNAGIAYDCSIEEGYQADQDGTNYFWPYTLDRGSPGNKYLFEKMNENEIVGNHPGLWEMPAYYVIIPQEYRAKVKRDNDYFDVNTGKLTGLDYNLLDMGKLTPTEFQATLKANLDLHYNGNRAPFIFGMHSDKYNNTALQAALTGFIDWALTKPDVRVVSAMKVIEWMRNPVPLRAPSAVSPAVPVVQAPRVLALTAKELRLAVPEAGEYSVSLFRLDGSRMHATKARFPGAGEHAVAWEGAGLVPGTVYAVLIEGGRHSVREKLPVLIQ